MIFNSALGFVKADDFDEMVKNNGIVSQNTKIKIIRLRKKYSDIYKNENKKRLKNVAYFSEFLDEIKELMNRRPHEKYVIAYLTGAYFADSEDSIAVKSKCLAPMLSICKSTLGDVLSRYDYHTVDKTDISDDSLKDLQKTFFKMEAMNFDFGFGEKRDL